MDNIKKIILIISILLLVSLLPITTSTPKETTVICATMSNRPLRNIPTNHLTNTYENTITDTPSTFSWTNYQGKDWTTPARYQGSCGSCWAFAAVAVIEAQINIEKNNPDLDVDLSEQYILSCLPSAGTCRGGWPDDAFRLIVDSTPIGNNANGIVTEACFPYYDTDTIPCISKCGDWKQNLWPIENYGVVSYRYYDTEALKKLLIAKGPLTIYLYSNIDFSNWGFSHRNPNDYFPYDGAYNQINHAVTLVGYKDDTTIGKGGYWICKNSWSPNWGYSGFFNIEYESRNIGKEVCWVTLPKQYAINFTYSPTILDNQQIITFTPFIEDPIRTYWWDFGDGYYSNLPTPKHQFYQNGEYIVKLTVTSTSDESATVTRTLTIPSQPPDPNPDPHQPDFTFYPQEPYTYEEVQFIDQTIGDTDFIEWDFGDGETDYTNNPRHTYTDNGIYTITLTTSKEGDVKSYTDQITIKNRAPTADFTYTLQDTNQLILTDTSTDMDGIITKWNWQCTNNEPSNTQNPTFTISDGINDVTLTITDDDGETDTKTIQINSNQNEGALDQQQETVSSSQLVNGYSWIAQSFIPTTNSLTQIDLYIRLSNNRGGLQLDITKNGINQPELTSLLLSPEEIPTKDEWVEFDIEDIQVNPGDTYYMVISSPYIHGFSGSFYLYLSFLNSYLNGTQYNSNNKGYSWNIIYSRDLCFRTYG